MCTRDVASATEPERVSWIDPQQTAGKAAGRKSAFDFRNPNAKNACFPREVGKFWGNQPEANLQLSCNLFDLKCLKTA